MRQLTLDRLFPGDPDWSPNGTRIAFQSNRSNDSEMYTMRVDGTGVRQLTLNDAGNWSPASFPDGTRIAFSSGNFLTVGRSTPCEPMALTCAN